MRLCIIALSISIQLVTAGSSLIEAQQFLESSTGRLPVVNEYSSQVAIADVDGDGDLDLLLTQAGDTVRLLRNDQSTGHHWIRIDPADLPPGSWIECRQAERIQRRVVGRTRSYLSQSERFITFGLGTDTAAPEIVTWSRDGSERSFTVPGVDQVVTIPGKY